MVSFDYEVLQDTEGFKKILLLAGSDSVIDFDNGYKCRAKILSSSFKSADDLAEFVKDKVVTCMCIDGATNKESTFELKKPSGAFFRSKLTKVTFLSKVDTVSVGVRDADRIYEVKVQILMEGIMPIRDTCSSSDINKILDSVPDRIKIGGDRLNLIREEIKLRDYSLPGLRAGMGM